MIYVYKGNPWHHLSPLSSLLFPLLRPTMMAILMFILTTCSNHSRSKFHLFPRSASTIPFNRSLCSLRQTPAQHRPNDSIHETSLLWLPSNRVRIKDNVALTKASELGPGGLGIYVVWPYGNVPNTPISRDEITPVEAFGYSALHSLSESLEEMGQKLWLLPSNIKKNEEELDSVSIMAGIVQELQPDHVIVDTCLHEQHKQYASKLRTRIKNLEHTPNVIEIMDEGLLIDYEKLPKALGRSRNGGRVLRWSTFLSNVLSRKEKLHDEQSTWNIERLSPQLKGMDDDISSTIPIPNIDSFPSWAKDLLSDWGEVSENEAIRRANTFAQSKNDTEHTNSLSEKGSKDSKLSPYLRWGVISPQRAAIAGVRKRDLLWRDWSYICYGLLNPLRNGQPVLKYMDKCNSFCYTDLNVKEKELFNLWIVGNTGSPLVDAGMRQLWKEGWMPRKIRLLTAACLVEGMGLDWRLGRDWFKYTLIDHDPAINELMWQNAGFVGVDPFYKGIAWEAAPTEEDDVDYVNYWANKQLVWPSELRPYAERKAISSIVESAKSRRDTLQVRGVYKAARTISNSGVRVAWSGLKRKDDSIATGDVMGVGLKSIKELTL